MSFFRKKLTILEHEELVIAGLTGFMHRELFDCKIIIEETFPKIETTSVIKQCFRDFLPIFFHNPPKDISLVKYTPSENSLMGYSCNKESLIESLENIAQSLDFSPHSIQDSLATQSWKTEFEIEKNTYNKCKKIAKILPKPIEKVFGMVRYSNFLHQYKNFSEEEAQQRSLEKYNITLP